MSKTHRHVSIDYYSYHSGISSWNTFFKVIFSVGALITVIAANSLSVSMMTLCYMILLSLFIARIEARDYYRLMLIPAAFILLGGITILVQFGQETTTLFDIRFLWTRLYITSASVDLALNTIIKAFAAVSALYVMTLSTPMGEIISVFRKIRVPEIILELMYLIYRYIFILSEIKQQQKDASGSRLGYCDLRTSFRTFSSEIATLFVLSMKKADLYYDAMEARGYEGSLRFWEEKRKLTVKQLLFAGGYITLLIACIWKEYCV
ncbi:MAG: cobalt ECF transporter T component CbiQ [Mobilitalea sp.]